MRFAGRVKSWNDDRGFGFIEPDAGGSDVFVHIKAFADRAERPQLGQRVTFEVELDAAGRKRAANVHGGTGSTRAVRPDRSDQPIRRSSASLLVLPAFALIYLAVAIVWHVSNWVALLYAVASLTCFAAYALDKWAATSGRRRIAERSLLFLGLIGGWPGAILAQQTLRHKSSKATFRSEFWVTVATNILGFVVIHSPLVAGGRI